MQIQTKKAQKRPPSNRIVCIATIGANAFAGACLVVFVITRSRTDSWELLVCAMIAILLPLVCAFFAPER